MGRVSTLLYSALCFSVALAFSGRAADDALMTEKPLERPHPRGQTLFTQLSPDDTGVRTENRYADPKMWGDLYQEFEGGSIGTGVAIGDYDGDGRPDLFVVSKTESCRLFRNLGGYKFEDVTERAGVSDVGAAAMVWKSGVTFVDVNNDGKLDLYVCRFNAPNLLYVNLGDGTFKESAHAYDLDVVDACVMASFCDYDRDGWLDVYIATNVLNSATHPKGQRGYLFHNNRDGSFTNVTATAGIFGESQSHSATWWDFDNDGWPDLYVANDYGVPDKLYRNNRDGTFTDVIDRAVPHTSYYSMGADTGDVNNDGLIDLLVADMAATTHEKDHHSVAESRAKMEDPENPAIAPKYIRSALLLNTGVGRCMEGALLAGIAATDWTWSVRFEDLDNDGWLDLHVTNGFNRDPNPDVHKQSMGAESTAERIRIMKNSAVLVETHLAFRNRGDLQFESVGPAWGLDQKGVSFGAALGDLNGDGNLDLVYSNYESGVTILRNDCDTGHRVMIDLRGTASNRFGVGAVVRVESALGTQTRQLSLARGYMSSSEPALHFGLGADTAIRRLTVVWPSRREQTFENLPVDRRFTITEPNDTPADSARSLAAQTPPPGQFTEVSRAIGLAVLSREEIVDERALQKLLPMRLNRRGPAIAVGRLFGEDPNDVVVGGTTVDPLRVLRATTVGSFLSTNTITLPSGNEVNDGPVLIFDANGDDQNDLLVTKGGNSLPAGSPEYQPRLFLNDGHGNLQPAPADALPTLPLNVGAVAAADFDHDGRLDVFLGGRVSTGQYPSAPASALLANRGGKLEDVTDTLAPGLREVGMVTGALWSDVDGDGWIDLLLTLEWGPVKYFHNQQGRGFEDWTEKAGFASAGSGWWTSITGADFNGDGKIDYVVGNVGLNTPYHADTNHPALLYVGDFKGGATSSGPQLIEAYYEDDRLYPRRSRRTLGASIPALLKKFQLNDPYARATLPQILGEDKLAKADKFAATELRSGVFLSQPDGTYRFEPLPRLAQIAPLQGIVAGDFDGDGRADIYAAQNSYSPIPSVGRFDGGLSQLLRGDGHGHFTPVPIAETGLLVPGDAKALAVVDLDQDGWPDFVVSRNAATTLAFRNGGREGRHSLAVELVGATGNPTAVGARVTAVFADHRETTQEVYCGSGYYSQSSATLFFGSTAENSIQEIRVRWPDGKVTSQEVRSPSGALKISFGGLASVRAASP